MNPGTSAVTRPTRPHVHVGLPRVCSHGLQQKQGQKMEIKQRSLMDNPFGLLGACHFINYFGVRAAWETADGKYSILAMPYGLSICVRTGVVGDGDIAEIVAHCLPNCRVWRTEISSDSDIIRIINQELGGNA